MYKDGVVTFSEWNKGQAKHPIYGFGLLQNVEVFENKGIAGNKTLFQKQSTPTSTPEGLPIAKLDGYTLLSRSDYGELWNGTTLLVTGLADAFDMIKYKDYIWVRYGANLGAWGPLSTSPQWFPSILTSFNPNFYGKIIQGQDGYLYSTSGNEVVKLDVTSYGIPATAPSVSISATLDLPDGFYATTVEEHGTKLVIGTQGDEGFYNEGLGSKARLYPWNRQAGTLGNPGLADLPVSFQEDRINAVLSHQNKLYVSAGTSGNIYMTDGTNYIKIATLPYTAQLFETSSKSRVYPNAMCISSKGTLLIGLSAIEIDSTSTSRFGVYEIDITDPTYPVAFRTLSFLNTANTDLFTIGMVRMNYIFLEAGWQFGSDYGLDATLPFLSSDYAGTIYTPLVKVGSYDDAKTFSFIEWSLASQLVENQSIQVSYRINNTSNWVYLNSWGYSVGGITKEVGSVLSFKDTFGSVDCEYIQLKIDLINDSPITNIQLVSVKIW